MLISVKLIEKHVLMFSVKGWRCSSALVHFWVPEGIHENRPFLFACFSVRQSVHDFLQNRK